MTIDRDRLKQRVRSELIPYGSPSSFKVTMGAVVDEVIDKLLDSPELEEELHRVFIQGESSHLLLEALRHTDN
jgi:hypothetical protein